MGRWKRGQGRRKTRGVPKPKVVASYPIKSGCIVMTHPGTYLKCGISIIASSSPLPGSLLSWLHKSTMSISSALRTLPHRWKCSMASCPSSRELYFVCVWTLAYLTSTTREAQRDGFDAWDCTLNEEVLVFPSILAMLGDNPMQSEFACHRGLKAKFFCRRCMVKGRDAHDGSGNDSDSESDGLDGGSDREVGQSAATGTPKKRKRRQQPNESIDVFLDRIQRFLKVRSN